MGEAVIALPAHLALLGRGKTGKSVGHKWFDFLKVRYRRVLPGILRFRYIFIVIFVGALVGSLWYAGNYMNFILFPSTMADEFYVLIELPTGTSLRATSDKVGEIEELIMALPDEELDSFVTRIGVNVLIDAESENYAAMAVNLTPYSERDRSADRIVEDLREKTSKLEGFDQVLYSIVSGGPPVGKPIVLRAVGSDDALRTALVDSVEAVLAGMAGVKDISRDDKAGKDQVEIKIDYDRLARLGLTVADVAQNVRVAYDGEVVTSVRYGDEDVDFRVMIEERAREELNYLNTLLIPNRQNRLIPLSDVARLKVGPGPSDYRHYDCERAIMIQADVDKDIITPLAATNAVLAHFDLDRDWPGMQFVMGGEALETEESMASLYRTLLIAVIGIYFLLVLLFNSFSQPILVLVAIPFGIVGVIIAFALHGEPFGFVAILGVVGLSGVVVNDSLVLVNHINALRKLEPAQSIKEIVADGTSHRLRAIVMTTLTTIGALLPLAYGLGGTAPFWAPMALALGWGLVFATLLTLVLVPCLYLASEDMRRILRRKKR
jgi:multidrug efflux pump subunit AcrB